MSRRVAGVVPYIVVAGSVIAVATGVVAVRVVGTPGMSGFLFFSNVAYWLLWTALAPAALLLGARFRFVAGAWPRSLAVHAAASIVFAAGHLAAVTVIAATLRAWFFAQPFSVSLAQIRVPMRIHVEWEITMYWALVGLAHARERMSTMEERLGAPFARIHRSTLVNLHRVAALEMAGGGEYDALMRSGARLRVTRLHRPELEARLRAME